MTLPDFLPNQPSITSDGEVGATVKDITTQIENLLLQCAKMEAEARLRRGRKQYRSAQELRADAKNLGNEANRLIARYLGLGEYNPNDSANVSAVAQERLARRQVALGRGATEQALQSSEPETLSPIERAAGWGDLRNQ